MASAKKKVLTVDSVEHVQEKLQTVRDEIKKIIIGQDNVVDQTITSLIAGGHVLLVGVPGLAKTLLVETVADVMGLSSARVQCTPDLMPADIIGSEVLEQDTKGKRSFRFIEGPVFTQFFMADEINRASPRTQSALLQAMQEKEVSIAGQALTLPQPFHVLATQNPIEQEGTYPLPEAQLDRFLMQISVDYPDHAAERDIVLNTTGNETAKITSVLSDKELMDIQGLIRDLPVGDKVVDMIVALVRSLRPGEHASAAVNDFVSWAPGPRGSQSLLLAARAYGLLHGRAAPLEEDVLAMAAPVLRHRMALNYKASASGITLDEMINNTANSL